MKRGKPTTTSEAWAELLRQHSTGKPQPQAKPQWLPLGRVRVCETVFQHRKPSKHASAAHIRDLKDKVRASTTHALDPLMVWWDGRGWVCLDGHHRIKAYRAAGTDRHHDIPVEVFEGTPEEAIAQAAKANTRPRLQMSLTEKKATAWRLVTTTNLSKARSADCAGVSERLIANMRAARKTLEGKGAVNLPDMPWESARRLAEGKAAQTDSMEPDALEKLAEEWAGAIGKALPPTAHRQPEVLAMALERFNAQMPGWLIECWQQDSEEEAEEEE